MSNKPTLDEILNNLAASYANGDIFSENFVWLEDAKQQLTQLIADIIGEDEDRNHRYNKNWQVEVDAQNYLRAEQRQRAKKRGIDLEAGDGA